MRIITILFIIIAYSPTHGQPSYADVAKLFFQEFSPCAMPVYCYEYDFEVQGENLIIKTKLYNSKDRVLKETVIYSIPSNRISSVKYFDYGSGDIFIRMIDEDISKIKNGVLEKVSFMPFDFNNNKLNLEIKKAFEDTFQSLIKELQNK